MAQKDCSRTLLLAWLRRVIYDYDGLRLFACENQSNNPTEKRDPKKEVEYDNSRGVRAFSLDGYDRGQKIKGQYQK
jgi:hypothetical protein